MSESQVLSKTNMQAQADSAKTNEASNLLNEHKCLSRLHRQRRQQAVSK